MNREDLTIILICAVIFMAIVGGIYFLQKESCSQKSISFENHNYGFFSGCMVKHKDRWIPLDNIRGFDDH